MKILIVAATDFEIQPLLAFLRKQFNQISEGHFVLKNNQIKVLITGVGMPLTIYYLTKELLFEKFDLVLNLGIAGAYNQSLKLGEVTQVIADRFGDIGVEEKDGIFTDVFELNLTDANQSVFQNGQIRNPGSGAFNFLKKVNALTVNKVHGSEKSIEKIRQKYPEAEIETMEGAGFALVCQSEKVNYLQIRSVSNYVEPRNRENWKIKEAIENLNRVAESILEALT